MDIHRTQFVQKAPYHGCLISKCIILLLIIGVHPIALPPGYASTSARKDVSFSIEAKGMPLKKACEIILNKTDYKIIFDPKWQDKSITLKLDNVPLSDGIRRIIKIMGITNYALVQNNNNIRVLSFDSITSDGKKAIEELNADSMPDTSSTDAGISLTLADMQTLKKKSEEDLNNTPKDTVVTPPSSSGTGLTLEELEALKQANKEKLENIPKNTVVTPPSSSGKELTLSELEALMQINKQNMESRPKDMVVTPPSASGNGLTIEELEALQKASK